ncbi:MAG: glycosyltransferase [Candidatus Paceibacterota bacterium]
MSEEKLTPLNNEKITFSEEEMLDPSKRAEVVLDHILSTEAGVESQSAAPEEMVTVKEAIHARPVLDHSTGRNLARVLFVTTDESVLIPDSFKRREYTELAKNFDEVHVFCLIARGGEDGFERAGTNLWFYQIRSTNWWQLPWKAKTAAREALVWNNIIRPDLVVAIDPFEAGLAGYLIAKSLKRSFQLHLYTDPFSEEYLKSAADNNWRLRIARYILKRVKSMRVSTSNLQQIIKKKYKKIKDIAVLPRFYNFTSLLEAAPVFDLHERHPDFVFIILAFGPLTADSYLHDLFSSLHRLLRNPRIGLVVVGDGPGRGLFEEKVKLLGIERSVVFQKEAEDIASYLKTADLLVEVSVAEDGEVRVLQAAAAGLPAVMVATDLRRDLFEDNKSALVCEPGDSTCIYQKTSKFINGTAMRDQLADNAQDIAKQRLHEDPGAHYRALALTIEAVLNTDPSRTSK